MKLNNLGKLYIAVLIICIACFSVIIGIRVHNSNVIIKETQDDMNAYNARVINEIEDFESNKKLAENFNIIMFDYLANKSELKMDVSEWVMNDIETFKSSIQARIDNENEISESYGYEIDKSVTPADNVNNEILFDEAGSQVVDLFYYDDIILKLFVRNGEIIASELL